MKSVQVVDSYFQVIQDRIQIDQLLESWLLDLCPQVQLLDLLTLGTLEAMPVLRLS
ncbi:hypothetical protein D3C74_492150 [compost metagenome]